MGDFMRKTAGVALAVFLLATPSFAQGTIENTQSVPVALNAIPDTSPPPPVSLVYLRAEGRRLMRGDRVVVPEGFGFRLNAANETDFAKAKSWGANSLHCGFIRQDLEDPAGAGGWSETGFAALGRVVEAARRLDMNLVFALRCPAGEEPWHTARRRDALARLWKEIARRMRGETIVAAYDLLEPPPSGLWLFDAEKYTATLVQALSAVRSNDTHHIVIVEGTRRRFADTNLAYGFDLYHPQIPSRVIEEQAAWSRRENVPVWCVEWGITNRETASRIRRFLGDAVAAFRARGIPWAFHTWRECGDMGIYRSTGRDIWRDRTTATTGVNAAKEDFFRLLPPRP